MKVQLIHYIEKENQINYQLIHYIKKYDWIILKLQNDKILRNAAYAKLGKQNNTILEHKFLCSIPNFNNNTKK